MESRPREVTGNGVAASELPMSEKAKKELLALCQPSDEVPPGYYPTRAYAVVLGVGRRQAADRLKQLNDTGKAESCYPLKGGNWNRKYYRIKDASPELIEALEEAAKGL